MQSLLWNMPTQVFFSDNCLAEHADVFKLGKKALIVTGHNSSKINGSLADVEAALAKNSIPYAVFDKVPGNPDIAICYEGAEVARKEQADFIVAIGGGSPMDAGKAIALLAVNDTPEDKLFAGEWKSVLPVICIPTTAGTGSEVTQYSILSDDKAQTKRAIASPLIFPKIALLDSKYQLALPRATTVNTALDALSHNVESMLSIRSTPLSSAVAKSGVEAFRKSLKALTDDALTADDRANLIYASTTGGIAIAQTTTNIVHALGYSLTYFRHIDHGRANALTLGAYLTYMNEHVPDKVAEVLAALKLKSTDEFKTMIDTLLGEKEKFTEEELKGYVEFAASSANSRSALVLPDKAQLLALYKQSLL